MGQWVNMGKNDDTSNNVIEHMNIYQQNHEAMGNFQDISLRFTLRSIRKGMHCDG